MVNLWFQDYVVFQSASKAAHYLRMKDGRMTLAHYDASSIFKEEASFRLAKKRGMSFCVCILMRRAWGGGTHVVLGISSRKDQGERACVL